jgi:hypothetical protein
MTSDRSSATGRRLGYLLVGYLAVVVMVITLAPFRIAPDRTASVRWIVLDGGWVTDVVLNVALFMPIGVALHRTFRWTVLRVVAGAAVASACIEAMQVFIAPRYSTVSDVVANALGAMLGAASSRLVDRRIGPARDVVGRLFLDLPLMGAIYLLLPLMWLNGFGAGDAPTRAWLVVPLAVAGALVLPAIARTVPAAAATAVARNVMGGTLIWLVVGIVPALRANPAAGASAFALALLVAFGGQWAWAHAVRRDRRIEPQVVRVVLPVMAAYAVMIALDPARSPFSGTSSHARIEILRMIERVAALATVAYLIAEWRGRRAESELAALAVPVGSVAVVSALLAVVTTTAVAGGNPWLAGAAAAFGATLYRRQRDHVVALSGRNPDLM